MTQDTYYNTHQWVFDKISMEICDQRNTYSRESDQKHTPEEWARIIKLYLDDTLEKNIDSYEYIRRMNKVVTLGVASMIASKDNFNKGNK